MSYEEPQTEQARRPLIAYGIGAVVIGVAALLLVRYLSASKPPAITAPTKSSQQDDPLDSAREVLSKSQDVTACRTALTRFNQYLVQHPEKKPARPAPAQVEFLKTKLGLDADELAEVMSDTFTPLDAHYLEFSLLLRETAQALELGERSPLERAAAAFGWVTRQVRLQERRGDEPIGPGVSLRKNSHLPPQFILRRGWGTAQERALVFLALLPQIGVEGCAVVYRDAAGDQAVYWACGAVVEDGKRQDIYLFDPRLGIPLPGPEGKGIATFADAQKRPDVLAQLTVDAKHPYDITPEKARQSELQLACPLSALAPRMKVLQDELLRIQTLRANVSSDPSLTLDKLRQAAGPEARLAVWPAATRGLRRLLPPEEGGVEKQHVKFWLEYNLAPRELLPPEVARMEGIAGAKLNEYFSLPFMNLLLNPRMPRDLLVRGRLNEASPVLVRMRDEALQSRARYANDPGLRENARAWFERARDAYAQLEAAKQATKPGAAELDAQQQVQEASRKVENLWKEGGNDLVALVQGAGAQAFGAEATYLLALCMQEQAERLQARSDQARRSGKGDLDDRREQAEKAWKDALGWWQTYASDPVQAKVFGAEAAEAAVRRLQARAHEALGEREEAIKLLPDRSGSLSEDEIVARAYLVQQLTKRVP